MRKTLQVLNDLERAGFFRRYAIGGAVAAIFYMEAVPTEDLDILVLINEPPAHPLMPLDPLNHELIRRGYTKDGPYDLIEGMPVQFIVAPTPLVAEAIEVAREQDLDGVLTRVPAAEYLAAIMIETKRPKDRVRFSQFVEQAGLDQVKLTEIMERYNLLETYNQWTLSS
ncbi:MAG: hypothetical protein ACR2IE_05385 [Candidatus Sumerlaeaceae bacterium]